MPNSRVTGHISPDGFGELACSYSSKAYLVQVLSNFQLRQIGAFAIIIMLLFLLAL